jgi:acyl carrier protein
MSVDREHPDELNSREIQMDQIQAVLAEALGLDVKKISPDLAFGDLPQWDSMGHMEVMMRLEEHFGVEINNDTIANLTSIPAIRQHLEDNHG